MAHQKKTQNPFRWFDSSPEVIRLVVTIQVRGPERLISALGRGCVRRETRRPL